MTETLNPVTDLSEAQCWELLHANEFGRIALSVANRCAAFTQECLESEREPHALVSMRVGSGSRPRAAVGRMPRRATG